MTSLTGRPFYVLFLLSGIAIILLGFAGLARMLGWSGSLTGIQVSTPAVRDEAAAKPSRIYSRRLCLHCGMIISMRDIPANQQDLSGNTVAVETSGIVSLSSKPIRSEIVVLMADGSNRTFVEDHPHTWREGARLIFIDGSGLSD